MIGTEGEVVITQDLVTYEILGEDETGRLKGKHLGTGIVRPAAAPFSPSGGLRLLQGNLGRAVIKVSAVKPASIMAMASSKLDQLFMAAGSSNLL